MTERTVEWDHEDLARLRRTVDAGRPLAMLNMLRYRTQANYPTGAGFEKCSGREAYARYIALVAPMIQEGGGTVLFSTQARCRVVAPVDEDWDDVLVARYSSVDAFLEMLARPDYLKASVHRTAALEDARLFALEIPQLISS